MSITSQNLLTNSNSRISFYIADTNVTPLKNPNLSLPFSLKPLGNLTRFQILNNPTNSQPLRTRGSRVQVFQSEGAVHRETGRNNLNLDSILSVVEFLCLASSAIVSVGFALNSAVSNPQKSVMVVLGNRILLWQAVALVGGVVVGSWIRRRQWWRICNDTAKPGIESVNLVERMEKMEEDLRSMATLIRVMSRQLEKLGIRFRVTRKALKQPIAETAVLAQKNSEATRALAIQEDILEKELGEIQKVLLAMQEQQQKQLDLILAIGKAGKLWENRRGQSEEQDEIEACDSAEVGQMKAHQIPAAARQKGTNNDRA